MVSVRSYAEQGSKSVKRAYIRNETSTHLVDQPAHPSQDKSGLQAQPRFNLPPSLIEVKQQRPTSTRPFESAAMSFVESPTSSFAPGLLPPSCLQRYRDDSSVVAQDEQQLFDSTFQQRHNLNVALYGVVLLHQLSPRRTHLAQSITTSTLIL